MGLLKSGAHVEPGWAEPVGVVLAAEAVWNRNLPDAKLWRISPARTTAR